MQSRTPPDLNSHRQGACRRTLGLQRFRYRSQVARLLATTGNLRSRSSCTQDCSRRSTGTIRQEQNKPQPLRSRGGRTLQAAAEDRCLSVSASGRRPFARFLSARFCYSTACVGESHYPPTNACWAGIVFTSIERLFRDVRCDKNPNF